MAPHPVDTLLARAQTHLAGARYPQAIGAFRAAVAVAGPRVVHAHLGLAEALTAVGRGHEAVDGLVRAAEACTAREEHQGASDLLGRALVLDPSRSELHLDLAMVEEALGRHDAAVTRLEGLADRYMDAGRFEDATELLRVLASWDDPSPVVAAPVVAAPVVVAPVVAAPEAFPRNTALITGATVIARNPLLPTVATTPPVRKTAPVRDDEVTRARARLVVVPRAARSPVPATPAEPRDAALVERLRARAGLRPAGGVAHPAAIRNTEPIAIRRSLERSPVQDDDVTRYFRRPRGLPAAS